MHPPSGNGIIHCRSAVPILKLWSLENAEQAVFDFFHHSYSKLCLDFEITSLQNYEGMVHCYQSKLAWRWSACTRSGSLCEPLFLLWSLLSFWEKDCSESVNAPVMPPEFFLHKNVHNRLLK